MYEPSELLVQFQKSIAALLAWDKISTGLPPLQNAGVAPGRLAKALSPLRTREALFRDLYVRKLFTPTQALWGIAV